MSHHIHVIPQGPEINIGAGDPTSIAIYKALSVTNFHSKVNGSGDAADFDIHDMRKAIRFITTRRDMSLDLEKEFLFQCLDHLQHEDTITIKFD